MANYYGKRGNTLDILPLLHKKAARADVKNKRLRDIFRVSAVLQSAIGIMNCIDVVGVIYIYVEQDLKHLPCGRGVCKRENLLKLLYHTGTPSVQGCTVQKRLCSVFSILVYTYWHTYLVVFFVFVFASPILGNGHGALGTYHTPAKILEGGGFVT